MSDPYEAGPPEYQPDEEPTADDIGVLFAAAAYEQTSWEWLRERRYAADDPDNYDYHGGDDG